MAAIQAWIDAGYPAGTCGDVNDAGVIVFPTVCTSGTRTIGEDLQDKNTMHPGGACNACHAASGPDRPIFSIAGTVYSTLHEKDDCNAAPSVQGSQVVVTGADGRVTTILVNATGNFFLQRAIALPFKAKVVQNGKEHAMQAPQTVGDCNSCHTEQGSAGSPGRITIP
jgi:cytochrome c553